MYVFIIRIADSIESSEIWSKMVILLILVLILLLSPVQLPFLDNNIATYGNAAMDENGIYGSMTWLTLDGEYYCYVDHLEGDPKLLPGVAGFSGYDKYSYEVFPLEEYPGLIAVHIVSRPNMVDMYALYASRKAGEIPAELVYDFPHEDDWFSGGQVTEMNGTPYCSYGSTGTDFTAGDRLFSYEGKDYFSVPGHSGWIAVRNEIDPDIYDLYYDTKTVVSLPVDLLFEVSDGGEVAESGI